MVSYLPKQEPRSLLFFFLSLLTVFICYTKTGLRYDGIILSVFFTIGILSLYGILLSVDSRTYSLNKSFCIFYYFFFFIAPVVQFKRNTVFYTELFITDQTYLNTGIILLLILLIYLFLYHILVSNIQRKRRKQSVDASLKKRTFGKQPTLVLYYTLALLGLILYICLVKFNIRLLIYRPFLYSVKENTFLGLPGYALVCVARLLPFVVLMHYKLRYPQNNRHTYVFLLLTLLSCFPSALSRGLLAVLYIPLLILFIPVLQKGINYVLMYLTGLLLVFPLFNNLRYLNEGVFAFNFELFNSAHFDAFQNLALLINEDIVTHGRQLLGDILFFVPESLWAGRPHGTGHLLGETVGYSYLNVSMPYVGEGYANWGYWGIALFLIVIVLVNAFFDSHKTRANLNRPLQLLYFIGLGFEFYLMRGDLWSSIKIGTSFLLAIICLEITFWLFVKKNHNESIKNQTL